jgi:hypothetical protein
LIFDKILQLLLLLGITMLVGVEARPCMYDPIPYISGVHYVLPFITVNSVATLKARFNASAQKWNTKKQVMDNLETVLGMPFMSPTETDVESFAVECGICYSYKLEGKIPEKVCDDRRCGPRFPTESYTRGCHWFPLLLA